MKRTLCIALVMFGVFLAVDARADDPPPPTITVLAYYDGSPELGEIYNEALAGFAEVPDYLPVVETADPVEFGAAVVADTYDVFIAVTADAAAAQQWAVDAKAGTSHFSAFYTDPSGEHEILGKLITHHGGHAGSPGGTWSPTAECLGGSGKLGNAHSGANQPVVVTVDANPLGDDPVSPGPVGTAGHPWWWELLPQDFREWLLNEARSDIIEAIAWLLDQFADLFEGLENTKITFTFKGEVNIPVPGGDPIAKGEVVITLETNGSDASTLARRLAGKLRKLK